MKGTPCSYSLRQYSCRCPCYNTQVACTVECRCKGCSNPFGIKPESSQTKIGQKRKRDAHHHQSVTLRGKTTASFMREVGEPATIDAFSRTEFLIVCGIIHSVLVEESGHCNWDDAKDVDASMVHTMYTSILELVKPIRIVLSIYPRTRQEIEKLLKLSIFKREVSYQYYYTA